MSKWLGRIVIIIGAVYGLKHWLCRLIQGLKYAIYIYIYIYILFCALMSMYKHKH